MIPERRDRDGENNRKTFIDLSYSLYTPCAYTERACRAMRDRMRVQLAASESYAACAHAASASCAASQARRARGARRAEFVANGNASVITPLNISVWYQYAEIGSEFFEECRREALCEDVGELACAGDVQNADVADVHFFTYEVDVELDVLPPLVMD